MSDSPDAALRPLEAVRDARASLRIGTLDAETQRGTLLRVCQAVDASLRRMLRDDPATPLELRLRALAPDELSLEKVIASLRQRDRLPLELAAALHDLLGLRGRLHPGSAVSQRDVALVLRVADEVEQAAQRMPVEPAPMPADAVRVAGPAGAGIATGSGAGATHGASSGGDGLPRGCLIGLVLALVLVAGVAAWWLAVPRGPRLEEGIALFRTGDLQRAAAHFERYIEARPREVTPRLYLARIHRRAGRFEAARDELRQALEIAPSDAALHAELGFLLLDVGQSDAAVGRFRTAVELDPASTEAWVGLVRALRESGQEAAAERVLQRAPDEARALVGQP